MPGRALSKVLRALDCFMGVGVGNKRYGAIRQPARIVAGA